MNAKIVNEPFSLNSIWLARTALLSILPMMVGLAGISLAGEISWGSLNLSPQQEDQINRLESDWERTHEEVFSQIERDQAELRSILPTGDSQRIRQLQNRITTNKMYLMNQSMDTFLRKRDALTPAQRQKLQKMLPARSSSGH